MHKLICLCCHDLFYHPKTPYKGIFCLPFDKLRALLVSHYSNKDVVLFLHPGDPAELCDSLVSSHFCISPREHLPWSCCLLFDAQHKGSPSDLTLPASPQRWLQSVFTQLANEELLCTEVLDLFNKKTHSSLTHWLKLYLLCNATALTVQVRIL